MPALGPALAFPAGFSKAIAHMDFGLWMKALPRMLPGRHETAMLPFVNASLTPSASSPPQVAGNARVASMLTSGNAPMPSGNALSDGGQGARDDGNDE